MNALQHVPRAPGGSRFRLLLSVAFAAMLAAATVLLPSPASAATQICSNQTGNNGGMYYQMWTAGQGSACITLNSSNSYSSSWSGIGDFVAGVGWNPGSTQSVTYNGSLNGSGGTALMSLYGWSTNPLVEYYVIDNWRGSPNTAGTNMGTMTSDGGTYTHHQAPSRSTSPPSRAPRRSGSTWRSGRRREAAGPSRSPTSSTPGPATG